MKTQEENRRKQRKRRFSSTVLPVLLPLVLLLGGCRSMRAHSPTIDIVGSYFPAWIWCIVVGLALTLVARQLLVGLKLNVHLRPAALVYPCMIILFTLAVWLAFYKN